MIFDCACLSILFFFLCWFFQFSAAATAVGCVVATVVNATCVCFRAYFFFMAFLYDVTATIAHSRNLNNTNNINSVTVNNAKTSVFSSIVILFLIDPAVVSLWVVDGLKAKYVTAPEITVLTPMAISNVIIFVPWISLEMK